jgi:hypothetical protein
VLCLAGLGRILIAPASPDRYGCNALKKQNPVRMKLCVLVLMGLGAVTPAFAAVAEGITSLAITQASPYLIASDSLTNAPGTDRDAVQVRTVVQWSNDAVLPSPRVTEYQLQLLDGSTPVSLFNEAGVPGTVYRFTNSVSVPGALGGGRLSRTNVFSLKPAEALQPLTDYRVRLQLGVGGISRNNSSNTPPRQFWHFTNLVSGDAALNVLGTVESSVWKKTYAIDSIGGEQTFQVTNRFQLVRYDDFNAPQAAGNVPVRLSWRLLDTNGAAVATSPSSTNFTVSMLNFQSSSPREPHDQTFARTISFRPRQQLDSVSNRYRLEVTLSLTNVAGQAATEFPALTTSATRLRHLSGTLRFGDVTATLTNLIGEPVALPTPSPADYLNLNLDGRAVLNGAPERDFDLAGPRLLLLRADGDASLAGGSLIVPAQSGGDYFTNGNFRIRRHTVTVSPGGATADLRFFLPAGFGLSTNYGATRTLESQFVFQDVGLNDALEPRTNLVHAGFFVASTESKPMLIFGERLTWSRTAHRFTLTPRAEQPVWGARLLDEAFLGAVSNSLASASLAIKRANDGYYRAIDGFDGNITLTASAQGVAQLSYIATFKSGSFHPHFPAGPAIVWTNGGRQEVDNNSVTPGVDSRLEGVLGITQSYLGSCAGCDDAATTNSLSLTLSNRVLNFTRDGGLIGMRQPGAEPIQNLSWGFSPETGAFAHRANAVSDRSFHMPGHFLRGVDDTSEGGNSPGVLHLTGVAATNLAVIERPLTSGYNEVGRTDYAGINIRSPAAGSGVGRDTITGTPVDFSRSRRSKYYVRPSGVAGIHEAVPGSFSSTLTLAGYPFTFDNYGLSFLNSLNVDSRTEGSVRVPFPANITLPFEELRLTCAGGLKSAELTVAGTYRHLEYWNADIQPQSMRFEGKPGAECDPTESYLVLGVQAHASHVSQPLAGILGFFPNGSLIPPAFNLPGVDSRFELPSQFRFAGPQGSGDWILTPVAPAYFTTNELALATNGYLSIAGKLNVPFFEDMKVHLHSGARTNGAGTGEIFLAGGWPAAGQGGSFGWEQAGKHYFNDEGFDASNRGFPAGISMSTYHGGDSEAYRARAKRNWLEVVDFDYPLSWDPVLRQFQTWRPVTSSLLLLTAEHQLTHLDPKQAILDIGQRYEGLPVVSLTHLLVDENGGGSGASSALRQAVGDTAFTGITNGLAAADTLLSDNPTRLVDRLIAAGVDAVVDNLMTSLNAEWDEHKNLPPIEREAFRNVALTKVNDHFLGDHGISDTIERRLRYLGNPQLGGQLFTALGGEVKRVEEGMKGTADSFGGGASGAASIRRLVALSAPQFTESVAGPEVEAALTENASSFQQLRSLMLKAHSTAASYVPGLAAVNSEWADELEVMWSASALRLEAAAASASDAVQDELGSYNYRLDDPFAGNGSAQLRARIRAEIANHLAAEPAVAELRQSIKHRLFDANSAYRSAANSVFAQYNTIARNLISRSLVQVDNNFAPGLDTLSAFFEVSRLQGHAEIQDESLRQLRLDGRFKLKVPEDMVFNAYLEIKELNSENTPEECLYDGGEATEVKFGATDVELDWISDGLRADVGTKITLVDGSPRGIAGSLQTRGPLDFAGFVIEQVGFALAFGEEENYIAANARVRLGRSSEIAGGVFFGKACDITPLTIAVISVSPYLLTAVNPEEIFGEAPFTGGFVYAEGMFPVFSLGCILEVRMIAGAGSWYFVDGPRFGGIIKAGISGTVLCALTASGDITMIGARQGLELPSLDLSSLGQSSPMRFVGMAHVEGCIGIWPFEVCIDGSTSVKYTEGGGWDADEP